MTSQVSTLLTGVQADMLVAIGDALPFAGAIFASIAGIMVGVKLFKKITGARA